MPLPPHLVRLIPGIGLAVTGAYVGWKLFEHFQEQSHQEERQRIKEQSLFLNENNRSNNNGSGDDNEEINRPQLCEWLGLPPDGLDYVPTEHLPLMLECMSCIPPAARVAFLEVFCNKFLVIWGNDGDQHTLESNLQEWMELFGSMTMHPEQVERCVVILSQLQEECHFIVLARCLRHVLQVDGRLGAGEGDDENMQNVSTGKMGVFLNDLYVLWNLNALDFLLRNLYHMPEQRMEDSELDELTEPARNSTNPAETSWQDVLDLLLAITEHGGASDLQMFVQQWKRLVEKEEASFDDSSSLASVPQEMHVRGYLTSLRLCLTEQTKEEGARLHILPSHHNPHPQPQGGDKLTMTRLLQKYSRLSDQRFYQVTLCCAKFAKPQATLLLHSLVAINKEENSSTSSSSASSVSSSSSSLPNSEGEHDVTTGSVFSLLSVPSGQHDKLD